MKAIGLIRETSSSASMLDETISRGDHIERRISAPEITYLTDVSDNDREALKDWIREGMKARGVKPTALAREVGVATTTITKFINDPRYKFTPTTKTLRKIERFLGKSAPAGVLVADDDAASDDEGTRIELDTLPDGLQKAVKALSEGRSHVETWQIECDALQSDGFAPGDLLLVEKAPYHFAGDHVLATQRDAEGRVRPIFRLSQKPYLVSRSPSQGYPIAAVDDDRVIVVGPIFARLQWSAPR